MAVLAGSIRYEIEPTIHTIACSLHGGSCIIHSLMTRHTDLQRGMEKEEENVGSVKRNTRKQKRKNKEPEEPEPHAIGQKIRDVNGVGPKAVEALLAFASPAPKGEREEVNRLLKELQLQKTTQRQAIGANKRDLECD